MMKAGRNDPCPCGSGRKYKHCCGSVSAAAPGQEAQSLIDAADDLRAQGRPREALSLYQRALALDARSAEAHNNLGNAYLELGEADHAVASYRRALELQPDNAQILCNLGNALRQLGRFDEGLAASERAIGLDPALGMAHNNLGLCLAGRGERARAAASYREALRHNPRYLEALVNLGDVLRELGQRREAVVAYREALELDPQRAANHAKLGYALFEQRQIEAAAQSLRRALALEPGHAASRLGLAGVLRVQGAGAEAEASCRAVLEQDPKSSEALLLLGELHADRGQFTEALELFERALGVDGACALAYCGVASHRRLTTDDASWREGVEALLSKPLPLGQEIALRYALGKYFDDLRQYDDAFASYRRANDLTKRYGTGYDRARLSQRVAELTSAFDAASLLEGLPGASDSELPVFIVGMPRSGTSLVEQILASHPEVFGAGEVRYWDAAYEAFAAATPAGPSLVAGLARDYLARVRASSGDARRVIDKMPANFLYVGLIHAVFPRARIIHMRRDPLDTCLSIYFQNFFNTSPYHHDFEDLAHHYGEYLRIMRHWRAVLPAGSLLEVPYEALVADQEGWTRRMLEFVGLRWDARCLDFHQTERVVITASRWQVRQKIHATSAGRWRHYEKHVAPLQHLRELAAKN